MGAHFIHGMPQTKWKTHQNTQDDLQPIKNHLLTTIEAVQVTIPGKDSKPGKPGVLQGISRRQGSGTL